MQYPKILIVNILFELHDGNDGFGLKVERVFFSTGLNRVVLATRWMSV